MLDHIRSFGSRFFVALQYSDYQKLWAGTALSQSGNWALIVSRAALALNLTGSSGSAGIVTFAAMIPSVVISPLAGYLADRFDRKIVLAGAYSTNIVANLILSGLVISGRVEFWQLVLLSFISGIGRATQMPSAQALLPNLIPSNILVNGVALHHATQQGGKMLGPLCILPAVLMGYSSIAFLISTALYIGGLAIVLKIRTTSTGVVKSNQSVVKNLAQGLSFVYSNGVLLSIFLIAVLHCALTMSYETLFPALSRDRLGLTDSVGLYKGGSLLMIGIGTGSFISSFIIAGIRSAKIRGNLLFVFGILSGVAPFALGLAPSLSIAIIAAFGVGLSQAGFMTLTQSMVQQIVPDEIRGRVMAVYSWHIQGFMASFNILNGFLTDTPWLNATRVLSGMSAIFTAIMFLSIGRTPLRRIYRQGLSQTERLPSTM